MKKIINHLIIAFFVSVSVIGAGMMTGCAQVQGFAASPSTQQAVKYGLAASAVAASLMTAKDQVASAEQDILAHKDAFTAQEWAQLAFTDSQINHAVGLVDNLTKGPGGQGAAILVNMAQLTEIYSSTKAAYLSARAIVQPKIATFTPQQAYDLNRLDASAQALDAGAQTLANAAPGTNLTPIILSALQVAALAAKVLISSGVIAAGA